MMCDGTLSTNSGSSMEPMQVATNSSNDTCDHSPKHEFTDHECFEALQLCSPKLSF